MNIYSSKGLKVDNEFVRLEYINKFIQDEYRRKLFVSFSRSRNNLFISYKDQKIQYTPIHKILVDNCETINKYQI